MAGGASLRWVDWWGLLNEGIFKLFLKRSGKGLFRECGSYRPALSQPASRLPAVNSIVRS
ncbi:hypothetical protein SMJ63A_20216 [Stenotrophomonas geniculata]